MGGYPNERGLLDLREVRPRLQTVAGHEIRGYFRGYSGHPVEHTYGAWAKDARAPSATRAGRTSAIHGETRPRDHAAAERCGRGAVGRRRASVRWATQVRSDRVDH